MDSAAVDSDKNRQIEYWRNSNLDPRAGNGLVKLLWRPTGDAGEDRRSIPLEISDQAAGNFLRVANNLDLGLFILFATAFKAVTARYTGDDLVSLVTPVYREGEGSTESDYLLFQDRVALSGNFKDNAQSTRRTVAGGYTNQNHFLSGIAGLGASDDLVAENVLMMFDSIHDEPVGAARAPVSIRLRREGEGIAGRIDYDGARVCGGLLAQFAGHCSRFLDAVGCDFSRRFDEVELLSEAEAEKLLGFTRGAVSDIPDRRLHELFEEQARATPDLVALIHGEEGLSYGELEARAERLARGLVAAGVRPGDFVALLFTRSIDMVAIMIAVGKAHAAFVPISPEEPEGRLDRILADTAPRLVVTNLAGLDLRLARPVLGVADLFSRAADDTVLPTPGEGGANMAAYAIFTSGSTGTPKGVVVEHRGIVNSVSWRRRHYRLSAADRLLLLFPYHFDAFVLILYGSIISGSAVVLVLDDEARQPALLAAAIGRHRVTHVCVTPALYQAILEEADAADLVSLKAVALAGDATRPATTELSRRRKPDIALSNEYGPTENSVTATCHAEMKPGEELVIGRPIDNVEVHIVDAAMQPVPEGVYGELICAGANVARGYLNAPAQTAERFADWRGGRIYRTGDIGRWRSDGTIEFRGRADAQVKVRGFRIELEEIRAALLSHPGVGQAGVLVSGRDADARLLACITESAPVERDALDSHLARELPAYMLPARIVTLDDMPLTATGKYDLEEMERRIEAQDAATDGDEAPASEVERRLVAIWRSVLGIRHIGVNQNFFALGGHSLKAARLLTRIRAEFEVDLLLDEMFRSNTVRRLATAVEREQTGRVDAIVKVPESVSYLLSSAQERMLVLANVNALQLSYNVPVAFEIGGIVDVARLERAIALLLDRHDSLRIRFVYRTDRAMQTIDRNGALRIAVRDLEPGENVVEAMFRERVHFDLACSPLLAVTLLREGGRDIRLLFEFHHIVIDEASLAIFFDELVHAYNGVALGAPPPVSYVDYAAWQRQRQTQADYAAKVDYWRAKLAKARLEPVHLPGAAGGGATSAASQLGWRLDADVAQGIRALCREHELTLFMFFAAAFAAFLSRHTGQEEIVFGSPVSERLRPETHSMIGLFLNTLLLVRRVEPTAPFVDYLRAAKEEILADFANSEAQLEDVVRTISGRRKKDLRAPFNVMLAMIEDDIGTLAFEDFRAIPLETHNNSAKVDLLLEVRTRGEDIDLVFEYAADRHALEHVEALAQGFGALLRDAVEDPSKPVGALRGGRAGPTTAAAHAEVLPVVVERLAPQQGGGGEQSRVEKLLTQIWTEVLGLPPEAIRPGESFFMLGGDSIRANLVAQRLRRSGFQVRLGEVFENDTIEGLSAIIGGRGPAAD